MSSGPWWHFILFIYLDYSPTHAYWNNQENRDWNHSFSLLHLNGWSVNTVTLFSHFQTFWILFIIWHLHTCCLLHTLQLETALHYLGCYCRKIEYKAIIRHSSNSENSGYIQHCRSMLTPAAHHFFSKQCHCFSLSEFSGLTVSSVSFTNLEKHKIFTTFVYAPLSKHWCPPLSCIKVIINWWHFSECHIFEKAKIHLLLLKK